jgi:hypothetical protein
MRKKFLLLLIFIIAINTINLDGQNLMHNVFLPPSGYHRVPIAENSFDFFLRSLPLKKEGSKVKYYNGVNKSNNSVYAAVIDLPIGTKDLHQCADAIIRLRADYLYKSKKYDELHFNFTNGMKVDYSKWRQGYRIVVKGNKTSWIKSSSPSDSQESYWKYLEVIWQYAGTASLEKELKPIAILELSIGDVFIKGGFPGHAVIVVDKAINSKGDVIFMLAQSYMPAQELQVLLNPASKGLSPWYALPKNGILKTPEWTFTTEQLRRF